ncbi:MAG TPA: hypothetical protein VHU91_05365, partial [Mycobacteriales bacterium]|nr:hypothetical protein [Mycobacteriales bacterium]
VAAWSVSASPVALSTPSRQVTGADPREPGNHPQGHVPRLAVGWGTTRRDCPGRMMPRLSARALDRAVMVALGDGLLATDSTVGHPPRVEHLTFQMGARSWDR